MPGENLNITQLLGELSAGNKTVVDALLPRVYNELRRLARYQLQKERPGHTLNSTALVHEAYLKLVDQNQVSWQNRAHFFGIAAQAMRRILVNHAHTRLAEKRGGGQAFVTLDEGSLLPEARAEEMVRLDEALTELETLNTRQSKIVEYRFFTGLTNEEIAELLSVSVPTVRRDWRFAKAWLSRELNSP